MQARCKLSHRPCSGVWPYCCCCLSSPAHGASVAEKANQGLHRTAFSITHPPPPPPSLTHPTPNANQQSTRGLHRAAFSIRHPLTPLLFPQTPHPECQPTINQGPALDGIPNHTDPPSPAQPPLTVNPHANIHMQRAGAAHHQGRQHAGLADRGCLAHGTSKGIHRHSSSSKMCTKVSSKVYHSPKMRSRPSSRQKRLAGSRESSLNPCSHTKSKQNSKQAKAS